MLDGTNLASSTDIRERSRPLTSAREWMDRIREAPELTRTDRAICLSLAGFMRAGPVAWPSLRVVAADAGCTVRWARARIARLEAAGVLRREPQSAHPRDPRKRKAGAPRKGEGQRQTTSIYRASWPEDAARLALVAASVRRGARSLAVPGADVAGAPDVVPVVEHPGAPGCKPSGLEAQDGMQRTQSHQEGGSMGAQNPDPIVRAMNALADEVRGLRTELAQAVERVAALEGAAARRQEQERALATHTRRMLDAGALGRPEEVRDEHVDAQAPPEGRATAEAFCAVLEGLGANGLPTMPIGGVLPARRAWAELCQRPDAPKLADVLAGLAKAAPEWKASAAEHGSWRFVPHLATWIRDQRWTDVALPVPEKVSPMVQRLRDDAAKRKARAASHGGESLSREEEAAREDREARIRGGAAARTARAQGGDRAAYEAGRRVLQSVPQDQREVCDICAGEHSTESCSRYVAPRTDRAAELERRTAAKRSPAAGGA